MPVDNKIDLGGGVKPAPDPAPATDYENQIKALKEENEKLKSTASKNAGEALDFKKRWQETLSETEKAKLEKQTLVEERNSYQKELKVLGLTTKYVKLGYEGDKAEKIAKAFADGDTDTVFAMQEEFIKKIRDTKKESETRGVPTPQGGTSDKNVTQDVFNKMDYKERVALLDKSPEVFRRLNANAMKKDNFKLVF